MLTAFGSHSEGEALCWGLLVIRGMSCRSSSRIRPSTKGALIWPHLAISNPCQSSYQNLSLLLEVQHKPILKGIQRTLLPQINPKFMNWKRKETKDGYKMDGNQEPREAPSTAEPKKEQTTQYYYHSHSQYHSHLFSQRLPQNGNSTFVTRLKFAIREPTQSFKSAI